MDSQENVTPYQISESEKYAEIARVIEQIPPLEQPQQLSSEKSLCEAITHFQQKRGKIGKETPLDFLDKVQAKTVLDRDGQFNIRLYIVSLLRCQKRDSIRCSQFNRLV